MTNPKSEEIKFPPEVVFKGTGETYLKVWTYNHTKWDQTWFLQFSGRKFENESRFEVINQQDGYVAIRSLHNGKYWNGNPGAWIRANGGVIDQYALFKPVIFEDNKVVFIYKHTGNYCKRLTADGWDSLLNAQRNYIDEESYLIVEEPVTKRSITNVFYDLEQKDIISLEPMVLDEQVIHNNTGLANDFTVNYNHSYTKSQSFQRSVAFTAGVKTTIKTGIPFVFEGKVEISASVTATLQWNTTETETSSVTGSITVKSIQPGKRVRVTISGEKATINVPFKYQQIDYMSDGSTKTTDLIDGVFKGVNQYFARYESVDLN